MLEHLTKLSQETSVILEKISAAKGKCEYWLRKARQIVYHIIDRSRKRKEHTRRISSVVLLDAGLAEHVNRAQFDDLERALLRTRSLITYLHT